MDLQKIDDLGIKFLRSEGLKNMDLKPKWC